jgi:4-diphosphocytidyl-2-C-methyl-D-erythritol kinase
MADGEITSGKSSADESVRASCSPVICCGSRPARGGSLTLPCPAKLNVFLEVLNRRSDGYHELDTVMLRTQFCDMLTMENRSDGQLRLRFSDATPEHLQHGVPLDDRNLIIRAAEALRKRVGMESGADFILHKQIPPESGLAGGSSNAASALLGLRQLWNLPISDSDLHEIAATLGSDINFLLSGARAAVCSSRGEIVAPVPVLGSLFFAAVRPSIGNSTGAVFRGVEFSSPRRKSVGVVSCLGDGDTRTLASAIFNRLTVPAQNMNGEMTDLMAAMQRLLGRPVFMSGSGSTVFVICESRAAAMSDLRQIESRLRRKGWLLEV